MEPIGTQLSNQASIEMTKDVSKPVARDFNLPIHSKQHIVVCSLSLLLVSSESCKTRRLKNSRTKICLSNQHSQFPWCQGALFIQLIYPCFLITIFPTIAQLHFLHINTHTTHNPSICSDEGLTLEMSALDLILNYHISTCFRLAYDCLRIAQLFNLQFSV